MMQKTKELNLCEGSIFKKMIIYSLPLMGTNLLQFLFNVVDIAVLAAFVGDNAVAAVGATGSIVQLLVNLFIGISVGANVMLARSVGEQDSEKA
ncbi:MAG: MATE family efflux transporter, partial [Clostridia bacterium]|nr:MATE family efflux transporter [Clostridia bacterium]